MSKIYLFIGDEQKGPYSEDELPGLLATGAITVETLYWKEGMSDWQVLGSMAAFAKMSRPVATTIAPPRRTDRIDRTRVYALVDPKEKALKGQNLSARLKPITVVRAIGILFLSLLMFTVLLGIVARWIPDAHKKFEEITAGGLKK